jgi:hypothetical protein
MRYAEEYKAIKDGKDIVEFVDKYGLIAFLDEFMDDIEGRQERYEKWRQENKTCENCKYWTEDGCEYWGDFVDGEDICGQWK